MQAMGSVVTMIYDIRLAHASERAQLMVFIHQHWRARHILSYHEALFDWQYLDAKYERYNFVVAVDVHGEIQAILGFIPLTQFDRAIPYGRTIWLAIWKVTDAAAGHKLGDRLLTWLDGFFEPDLIAANAISPSATHRYRERGYVIGRLDHWFIINSNSANRLAVIGDVKTPVLCHSHNYIEKITAAEFAEMHRWSGEGKTAAYFTNRYFRHPVYSYDAYRIHDRSRTKALFVARTCRHDGASAMRIVEFVGPSDALLGLRREWLRLLEVTGDEYVDFYNAGMDRDIMAMSGFTLRQDGDGYVIPNYFEPFEQRNVEIETMTSVAVPADFRIFKGDSDQDRPNMVTA